MISVAAIAPACARVANDADHVKINHDKIAPYAAWLLAKYPLVTEIDPAHHFVSADAEETARYILALDSINFGSGYFRTARDCGIDLEYAVVAGGLKKAFEQKQMNSPEQWAAVTAADMSRIFNVPLGRHADIDALLGDFSLHLRETGQNVLAEYGRGVTHMLETAGYSAPYLADIVAQWKGFHDAHDYKGRRVPILKRAQILAADINLALGGKLKDVAALTMFSDNMVPHVLRHESVLTYAPALAEKIDGGVFIAAGSAEEIELRAVAIHAVELMKQAAHKAGHNVTSVNLDHLLWHRGYEPDLYSRPTHRTLTTDY